MWERQFVKQRSELAGTPAVLASVLGFLCFSAAGSLFAQTGASVHKHVEVFRRPGRFAGWPANHGAWSWGNELLVGFEIGSFRKSAHSHAIDYDSPVRHVLARSLDGGETWSIEEPEGLRPPPGTRMAGVPALPGDRELTDCPGGVDFSHPDFMLSARMTDIHAGQSRFCYSMDRGKTWMGPYRVPNFGLPGTAARTDYLINGKHDLTMLLTVPKSNGREGRVLCVRTRDGARTWQMQAYVCPEPKGREYAIMPSSVRLPSGKIVTAIRYRDFIEVYCSDDGGHTWRFLSRAADKTGGNPASMIRLLDGRLVLTYGYRRKPYGIRARISPDEGKTWGPDIVLRADGGNWDLGYPRTMQRADGKLVTVYYFNTHPDAERFIAATIWDAGKSR